MILSNLLAQGESVAIYEPPKSGKMSLIQQTLFNMRLTGKQFYVGQFSLLNIRTITDFLLRYGSTAMRTVATTPAEYAEIADKYLKDTHFVFDQVQYEEKDEILSTSWTTDDNDMEAILKLPWELAAEHGQSLIMILDEFQNISLTEDGDKVCKTMSRIISEMKSVGGPAMSLIFNGSMVNAMKEIFERKRLFYRQVEHLELHPANEKEIVEHVVKGFLAGGKVVERELLKGMCVLFKNHLWYINHFVNICDYLSKGYIVEATFMEALGALISIHEPRFMSIMNSLTTYQVSFLKAVLDGVTKFSAQDVITNYQLNSSANVKRVRDALIKKEVITFDAKDEPIVLDPLFEYWVRKYYFEMDK